MKFVWRLHEIRTRGRRCPPVSQGYRLNHSATRLHTNGAEKFPSHAMETVGGPIRMSTSGRVVKVVAIRDRGASPAAGSNPTESQCKIHQRR